MSKFIFLFFSFFLSVIVYSQSTVTVTINSPGPSSWQVPCGITSITVHCWGGGGAGGAANQSKSGAGGGGAGGYGTSVFAVTPGANIAYTVGAGGSVTPASSTLTGSPGERTTFSTTIANGGNGGGWGGSGSGSGTSGAGGTGGTAVGTTTVTGGNGSVGSGPNPSTGGAGGNAGGPGGGNGGAGSANSAGTSGNSPGGGGSGGSQSAGSGGLGSFGGAGGDGQIRIIYNLPVTVNAGSDITLGACTSTNTTLSATAVSAPWSGSWTCSGCSGINIVSPSAASSAVNGAGFTEGSSTTFIWSVTNGTCIYQSEVVVRVPTCSQTNSICATAFPLTVNAPLRCGQSTNLPSGDGTETCRISGTGQAVWYSFTAPTTSLVLSILGTETPYPNYGLFTGPCSPACSQNLTYSLSAGDPGKHTLLTGLTVGTTYYLQVQSSSASNSQFCISVNNVATNSTAPANAAVIDNCGVTLNGTTNGGYYPSGSSTGFNNLDGNSGTTVAGASQTGDDVTFIVNNISWFKFCSVNTGTYNVQFNVTSCVFSGLNSGSQMAILTGTNNNMTNIWQAANPTRPTTPTQTSPNFSLAAGSCAFLVVDGFAGDACSYSYILTNVAGGCILLPVDLESFNAHLENNNVLVKWSTLSELNTNLFVVEKSTNGVEFTEINRQISNGNSYDRKNYYFYDSKPYYGTSYYRLKQIDNNGEFRYSHIESVSFNKPKAQFSFNLFPNPFPEKSSPYLSFEGSADGKVLVTIRDFSGKIMSEKELALDAGGKALIELNHSFTKGIYFIDAQDVQTGTKVHQKFIVN